MLNDNNMFQEEMLENLTETKLEPWMKLTEEGWDVPVGEMKELKKNIKGVDTDFRIYYPENRTDAMPMLFFIHGGAYVGGFNVMDEPVCRKVCSETGCVVVSPNYQLAPENKWPAAIEQMYALLETIVADAKEYKINPDKVAVGGSSAGGNFAAVLCVMAYQRKTIQIKYQVLVYPSLDFSDERAKYDAVTAVLRVGGKGDASAKAPEADKEDAFTEVFKSYAPEGADYKNPLISPLYAPAAAFPKTCVFSGREDLLWYEGREFVKKLTDAGVEVLYKSYGGIGHGFMELAGGEHVSRDVKNIICAELKRNLCDI